MELDKLTAYLGFDISPATRPMNRTIIHCFGKRYDVTFPANVPSVLVERGMRVNSLDYFLYGLAKDAGVNFIFDTPVKTKKDFAELPPTPSWPPASSGTPTTPSACPTHGLSGTWPSAPWRTTAGPW